MSTRRTRSPHDSSPCPPEVDAWAPAVPSTRGAPGSEALASASRIIPSESSMARFTPEATIGFPAKRARSLTPTSVAKMTASAPEIVAPASGLDPAEPWVSTSIATPARAAAASSASAAM